VEITLESAQKMIEQPMEKLENLSPTAYLVGVLGSVLLSLGLYASGRRHLGIFVGLWAPTILNAGLFAKMFRPSREA